MLVVNSFPIHIWKRFKHTAVAWFKNIQNTDTCFFLQINQEKNNHFALALQVLLSRLNIYFGNIVFFFSCLSWKFDSLRSHRKSKNLTGFLHITCIWYSYLMFWSDFCSLNFSIRIHGPCLLTYEETCQWKVLYS